MVRMSRLLDEVLELDEVGRREWLASLGAEDQDIAAALREALLLNSTGMEGALSTLPKVGADGDAGQGTERGLKAGARFGPYELIRPLGAGGMAEVWLARRADGAIKREVALKLPLLTRLRRDLEPRFAREREILGGLSHPNIARLYDAGFAQDGQPYIALEYVVGTTLTEYCDQQRLTIRGRLGLFRQVLSAVQYAHTHLVIHRDLKPSNVLVTEAGQVQLLDFGIAKLLSEGEAKETELTQLAGRSLTPDYAAPEQIEGTPITTAADVYALGVMLYEILTGERPYRLKRDTRAALEEAILQANPVPPSRAALSEAAAEARFAPAKKLSRALKGDLDVIALKALKKSTRERYQTASALDEDIGRFLAGEIVLAQPDSIAYRANKFARRHWVAIAVVSVLILTLAGGLAATSYEANVASSQRDLALQAQLRSLTQTAAARLKEGAVSDALGILIELLPRQGRTQTPVPKEAFTVFQDARAADLEVFALGEHQGAVWDAEFSPDGSRIVTASSDNFARVWQATTGRLIDRLVGHTGRVISARFSSDGRYIVTASKDNTSRVWAVDTARQTMLLSGHTDMLTSAVFSPDGHRVLTASRDNTARIWDVATGHQVMLLRGHTAAVLSAAFSPDGRHVVTASSDRTSRIWDAASGTQLLVLRQVSEVTCAAFAPDGRFILTGSDDLAARLWNARTGQQISIFRGHTASVNGVAFSPDGLYVLTTSADATARVWDIATGQPTLLLSGHTQSIWRGGFSTDGRRIVTASYDGTARVWDSAPGKQLVVFRGHTGEVNAATFSPDGHHIVTASLDNTSRVWDVATGQQLVKFTGHTGRVISAAFSPDGREIVSASEDKTARVWDVATGRQTLILIGHGGGVQDAKFSPDGRRIVTASGDKTARIWDAATGAQLRILSGHQDLVVSAAFSPDGHHILTASGDKTARIWDSATGAQLRILSGHEDLVVSAAFSPDGRQIVTASYDKTARTWDAQTGQPRLLLTGHTSRAECASFSPDGRRIVTTADDGTVRVWDAMTGRSLLLIPTGTQPVSTASFSPDGSRVLTADDDKTARIWDASAPTIEVQTSWAEAAQFDPLSSDERYRLGLPNLRLLREWRELPSQCDELAAAFYDPRRRARGVTDEQIVPDLALTACNPSTADSERGRTAYQHGRAEIARDDLSAAKRDFESAIDQGYGSARVELARLLCHSSAEILDVRRAISLYEEAWDAGVTIAAYELGKLYELGVSAAGVDTTNMLAHDGARAWSWYQMGADAGEPNALARFAERDDDASVDERDDAKQKSLFLSSFRYYTAAAERARIEDWPDDAWRNWRYRRASLARLLARAGRMQDVAEAYQEVRTRYSSQSGTVSNRLESLFHRAGNE
jgi:WD40 repeat protein/serine/threonine protein kinase